MITEKQVVDYLKSKDKKYAEKLIDSIEFNSNYLSSGDKKVCPICGSVSIKKNGKDSNDNQRYYCHDCHHTFNDRTGTLLYWSHISREQWKTFIDYEIARNTLDDQAHFLGISVTTCFFMRHKLYSAASEIISNQILSDEVEVDTEYLKINLKGTKKDKMPRISKKRGNSSAFRGISHHKISVVCAIDSHDHMIMKVTGLGPESFDKYKQSADSFENVTKVISDSKTSIQQFANLLKAPNDKIPTTPLGKRYLTDDGESLGAINQMMSEISRLITTTKGFSTRYMQGYLDFHILRKQIKYQYKRDEMAEQLLKRVMNTKAFSCTHILKNEMPVSLKEAYYEYRYGIFA